MSCNREKLNGKNNLEVNKLLQLLASAEMFLFLSSTHKESYMKKSMIKHNNLTMKCILKHPKTRGKTLFPKRNRNQRQRNASEWT